MNIGSGTGYLSTLAGQLLGPRDSNHGIEIFSDVIEYANSKIEHFVKFSETFDPACFSKPRFVQGNINSIDSSFRQYDRVYVGARICNDKIKGIVRELVKVGGILIYPVDEHVSKS